MPASRRVVAVALIVTTLALAGCLGGPATDDPGDGAPGTGTPGGDGGTGADGDGSGTDGDGGDGGGAGDGDGSAGGNGDGGDGGDGSGDGGDANASEPRTPTDAMPGLTPAETGEGWAKFEAGGEANFRAGIDAASHCFEPCAQVFPLTVVGDETLVEVVLTWETDLADIDLAIQDGRNNSVVSSSHGQAFYGAACDNVPVLGDCVFLEENGTTWEHVFAGSEAFADVDDVGGDWAIIVTSDNVWTAEALQGMGSGGTAFTLEVWVHTVPAEPSHSPAAA